VFPVVKKLPVLLIGNISAINKKIKAIIILLSFNFDFMKYFLKNVRYKIIMKIVDTRKKPMTPVSVSISK
tara:strand:+ start:268 stop:477 length:210 start_codon:yes stop_codon:yes gene_type:complete